MNLFDQISEDIKKAMLAKDKVALDALRGIKKEFLEAKTAKGADGELPDERALQILQKMVKQRKEAAEMFRAAADREFDFVGEAGEYARRAALTKEIFIRNGFHIVYEKDGEEPVSDGFFYTAGYKSMTGTELMGELMRYGICTIALSMTGSRQEGVRVCISQMNRPEQFDLLSERLRLFAKDL